MEILRRFDDELSVVQGLIELRRRGVPLRSLETELTAMGPVDLDILYEVLDRVFAKLERDSKPLAPGMIFGPAAFPVFG